MTIAKVVYESPLFPNEETLTANIQRAELFHGKLVALTSYTRPKEEDELYDYNVFMGIFRKKDLN